MIEQLPLYISIVFGATTIATLVLLFFGVKKSANHKTSKLALKVLFITALWLFFQAILALNNVYLANLDAIPPTIALLGVVPAFIGILLLFVTKTGKQFIDNLPLLNLTFLHIVRIPVELVLFWLFTHNLVPRIMTFEGQNLDILTGISAPIITYFGFVKKSINPKVIITWNIICLALLINIVITAILSVPTPLQQLAFDYPNTAILYFPFAWLPTFVVPVVAFCHLAALRQLLVRKPI